VTGVLCRHVIVISEARGAGQKHKPGVGVFVASVIKDEREDDRRVAADAACRLSIPWDARRAVSLSGPRARRAEWHNEASF